MRPWGLVVVVACGYHPPDPSNPAGDDARSDSPSDTASDTPVIQPDSPLPPSNIIEAEAFTAKFAGDDRTWNVATTIPGFSGASYMLCGPGNGDFCDNNAALDTCAASMDYAITIPAAGTYFVHVRALATSGAEDSFWYGMDNVPAPNDITPPSTSQWVWRTGTTTYPLVAGAHKLTIWQRECGAKVDVVAVTDSPTPPP